jgi:membrane associated rhomboid family serine protease
MTAKATFGKRGMPASARPAVPVRTPYIAPPVKATQSMANAAVMPEGGALDAFHAGSIPILTIGLILLLCLVFALEVHHTMDFSSPLMPSVASLRAMGGVQGTLVFGEGQWWRLLTAPLLHSGLSHLIGNCIALLLAGFFLEPILGGPGFWRCSCWRDWAAPPVRWRRTTHTSSRWGHRALLWA